MHAIKICEKLKEDRGIYERILEEGQKEQCLYYNLNQRADSSITFLSQKNPNLIVRIDVVLCHF